MSKYICKGQQSKAQAIADEEGLERSLQSQAPHIRPPMPGPPFQAPQDKTLYRTK